MKVIGDERREGKTQVSITVSNVGTGTTTLKGVGMELYESLSKRIRGQAESAAVFPSVNDAHPLPHTLEPGKEWSGLIPQKREDKDFDLEKMSREGHLVIWLSHSQKRKPIKRRLKIASKNS